MNSPNGAFLINKPTGISSFGVIEALQKLAMERFGVKFRQLPAEFQKMGHGGTLDPFATGLLIVCVGRGVKLSRYFLGSVKRYEAVIRFGETTIPGDPTEEISERSDVLPESLALIREMAERFAAQPYLQTPPMHSAKKKDGKPLYELARQGIEIEREPKLCHLYAFVVHSYESPEARVTVECSSGTYIRTLAQDFSRFLGTVGMLSSLHRTGSGSFSIKQSMSLNDITSAIREGKEWDQLPCFITFDDLLKGYPRAEAAEDEAAALIQGRQNVLFSILQRVQEPEASHYAGASDTVAIYSERKLVAIAKRENSIWGLERVFPI